MPNHEQARQVAAYIESLNGFGAYITRRAPYRHMGALITDAVLQPGLNYRSVVAPRVARLTREFPDANTTSSFAALIDRVGPRKLLSWRHPEKPRRLVALTQFLLESGLETWTDLRAWLHDGNNRMRLLSVRGVGPKTCDYIVTLVGLPTVAVDRHIQAFVRAAGVGPCAYRETRAIVLTAASILQIDAGELDHAIWSYAQDLQA